MSALALLAAAACVAPGPHVDAAPAGADDGTTFVNVKGAWLRARVEGPPDATTTPIVMLHGYGSRLEAWKLVQPALAADRRVVAFDHRGFGLSERPEGVYGPDAHADDVVALMDALHIDRAILVGHSYGAGVALRVALQHPDRVAGLALVSAFAFEEQIPSTFRWAQVPFVGEALFGGFYQEVPGEKYLLAFHDRQRFVSARALEEMKALMAREGSTYAALQTVRGMDYVAAQEKYASIRAPIATIFGENDRVTPPRDAARFAAHFDGAVRTTLPACGHMPPWERPRDTIAALQALVARVESTTPEPRRAFRAGVEEQPPLWGLDGGGTIAAARHDDAVVAPSDDGAPRGGP